MTLSAVRSRWLPSTQLYQLRDGLGRLAERRAALPRDDAPDHVISRIRGNVRHAMWDAMVGFSASRSLQSGEALLHNVFCTMLAKNLLPIPWHASALALGNPLLVGCATDAYAPAELRAGTLSWGEISANFGILGSAEYVALRRSAQRQAEGRVRTAAAYAALAGAVAVVLEPSRLFIQACIFGACTVFVGMLTLVHLPLAIVGGLVGRPLTADGPGRPGWVGDDWDREADELFAHGLSQWSSRQLHPDLLPASLVDQVEQWAELASTSDAPFDVDVLAWDLSERNQRILGHFLQRLKATPEFRHARGSNAVAQRVRDLLEAMAGDEALRARCIERIDAAVTSCDDRIILGLNDLELLVRVDRAMRADVPRDALWRLGIGLMKLEIINDHARQWYVDHRRTADDVEVYLHFQVYWRDKLDLPVTTSKMRFSSGVSPMALREAGREAIAHARDPERCARFLQQWAPWQALLRREAAAKFACDAVPTRPLTAAQVQELQCCFTLQPFAELQHPLVYGEGAALRVCDQTSMLRWWAEEGCEPERRAPLALAELARPVVAAAPAGQAAADPIEKRVA